MYKHIDAQSPFVQAYLLPSENFPVGDDENLEVSLHLNGLSVAIRAARVVYIARQPTRHSRIHHPLVIQPEHVDSTVLGLVAFLSHLRGSEKKGEGGL